MKKKLILLISLLLPMALCAQSLQVASDTLLWKAETLTDRVTDTTLVNASEFLTYGTSKVVWTQTGNGEPVVFEFTVTGVDNHWSADGYVVLTTTRKNKTQTFRFEQADSVTKVTLAYALPTDTRTLVFNISDVSPFADQP